MPAVLYGPLYSPFHVKNGKLWWYSRLENIGLFQDNCITQSYGYSCGFLILHTLFFHMCYLYFLYVRYM